ncbi:hypothetical protein MQX03_11725 [Chryseobacterium aahli]|uniref:hypothetical protein n=1 Tax=Chryseobacterium aahli TaxID=1278643 RepID=UPI001F61BCB3|nr:hypothetical protein [Chryseobacterium aahli]MCI3937872.1 hypothetical protein [Chryseobacterium aahli]
MKTKTKKSVKTFKVSHESLDNTLLLINVSSVAQVNTNVKFLAEDVELYDGSEHNIQLFVEKSKRLRVRHIFDFSGINDDNVESAMHQTNVLYALSGQNNKVFPFLNSTKADLDAQKRIISVKVITIK